MTVKFDGWTWNARGHIFSTIVRFVHHFRSFVELKLHWHFGNAQLRSNLSICPTWHWNLTDNLAKNRATILCHVKICASLRSHRWNQTGVTARKRSIRVKNGDFCRVWPWNMTDDLEKQYRTFASLPLQALYIIWQPSDIRTGVTARKGPCWGKICFDICDSDFHPWALLLAWPSLLSMVITLAKRRGGTMTETLWKGWDRRTDRTVHKASWSQLKTNLGCYFLFINHVFKVQSKRKTYLFHDYM